MNNLLTSGFRRLFKNKIFYGTLLFSFLEALFMFFNEIHTNYDLKLINFDDLLINNLTLIGLPIAFLISFFIGIDYANGTIRNKIIVGHSRKNIYFSNLIICIIGSLIIELAYLIPVSILGFSYLKGISISYTQLLFVFLDVFMIIVLLSSIYNLAAMLISDITVSSITCIILTIIMIIWGMLCYQKSIQDKYIEEMTIIDNVTHYENVLNEAFEETPIQKICKIITYITPKGQANILSAFMPNSINEYRIDHDIRFLSLYSLGSTIVLNVIGIYFFKKKNIK